FALKALDGRYKFSAQNLDLGDLHSCSLNDGISVSITPSIGAMMIGVRAAERAMPGAKYAKQRPAFLNGTQPFNIGHVMSVEQSESFKHRADLCTPLSAFLQFLAQFSPLPS